MKIQKPVILVILLFGLFLFSCARAQPAPLPTTPTLPVAPMPSPTSVKIDAAKLYSTNCVVCHGEKRQGVSGIGPALTPSSLAKLSEADVKNTILMGRPNTAMSGFEGRLSTEEIDALVQLIKRTSP